MSHNNFVSIMSGSFLAMVNYISSNPINIGVGSFEVFKVFAMGVVGGFGGYVGKALVQKVVIAYKQKRK